MEKVNIEVMKQFVSPFFLSSWLSRFFANVFEQRWISSKVIEILGNEDEVVIDFVYSMLEDEKVVRSTPSHNPPLPPPWFSNNGF